MTINVEVFTSPGCGKCGHALQVLHKITDELEGIRYREVNIIEEMDYAVDIGVLSTPSIAINGELVYTTLPSAKKLRKELEQRIVNQQPGETE